MKTKLLFAIAGFAIFSTSFGQQEAVDYLSNLEDPSAIVTQGTTLYVQGGEDIYEVNTAAGTPSATSVYSTPADFYMTNMALGANKIYISEENYIQATDTYVGCRIISIDLGNLAAPPVVVHTTTQYITSLAVMGQVVYFSSEAPGATDDDFVVQISSIDTSLPTPVATVVVPEITENEEVNDMAFYNNHLLVSVGGDAKVYSFDVTQSPATVVEYLTALSFNKGIFVAGDRLFTAEGNMIKMKELNSPSAATAIAKNTTYLDTNGGTPFFANFRDVVLIGDKLYMTLQNQGKIVMVEDESLSAGKFAAANKLWVSNSKTQVTVNGLENNHDAVIYNMAGQKVGAKSLSANENGIDIATLTEGVYILVLDNKMAFKFIK